MLIQSQILAKIVFFNKNFQNKSKLWTKISTKIENIDKNRKVRQKTKISTKIENFDKNQYFLTKI